MQQFVYPQRFGFISSVYVDGCNVYAPLYCQVSPLTHHILYVFPVKNGEILKTDYIVELKKLNLQENISQQRSNGLTAVINKVIGEAQRRVSL